MALTSSSCVHEIKRVPNSDEETNESTGSIPSGKRHVILTLGGLRSTKDSFGVFHKIIGGHLQLIDPSSKVIVEQVLFDTHDFDFDDSSKVVPQINETLKRLFSQSGGEPRPGDRISVVMYSMGGNIGLRWLNETIVSPDNSKYIEYLENFITLGAPFWGAKEAGTVLLVESAMGFNLDKLLSMGWVQGLANTTRAQVEFISPLSNGSFLAR